MKKTVLKAAGLCLAGSLVGCAGIPTEPTTLPDGTAVYSTKPSGTAPKTNLEGIFQEDPQKAFHLVFRPLSRAQEARDIRNNALDLAPYKYNVHPLTLLTGQVNGHEWQRLLTAPYEEVYAPRRNHRGYAQEIYRHTNNEVYASALRGKHTNMIDNIENAKQDCNKNVDTGALGRRFGGFYQKNGGNECFIRSWNLMNVHLQGWEPKMGANPFSSYRFKFAESATPWDDDKLRSARVSCRQKDGISDAIVNYDKDKDKFSFQCVVAPTLQNYPQLPGWTDNPLGLGKTGDEFYKHASNVTGKKTLALKQEANICWARGFEYGLHEVRENPDGLMSKASYSVHSHCYDTKTDRYFLPK